MRKWIPFLLLFLNIFLLIPVASFLIPPVDLTIDTVAVNRIQHSLLNNWPEWNAADYEDAVYPFTVLHEKGHILLQSQSGTSSSLEEAIQNQDLILDFKPDGHTNSKILFQTNTAKLLRKSRTQLLYFAAFLALFWSLILFLFFYLLDVRLLAPFRKLKHFAIQVAQGNLDLPLEMDSGQVFGAFTESFDLMRDKLAETKNAEALANQSKKELVASLSHDIKTPVTSIKLLCELLQLQAPQSCREKLDTLYAKAEQIDKLVSNLFQSAMEDLGELKVHNGEVESSFLSALFQNVNYYGTLKASSCPGCILLADPLRLEQVIDNIVNNSYKYAKTEILVGYQLADEFLQVSIQDYGPGVSSEELPHLTHKFFRGKTAVQSHLDGGGLGLYLAHYLMERMNGELSCHNLPDGFCVTLLIPLA